ncbi:hypothetical protein MNBD_NITROSPIRAE02-338, partial [hydrothermal vent metagenome]
QITVVYTQTLLREILQGGRKEA